MTNILLYFKLHPDQQLYYYQMCIIYLTGKARADANIMIKLPIFFLKCIARPHLYVMDHNQYNRQLYCYHSSQQGGSQHRWRTGGGGGGAENKEAEPLILLNIALYNTLDIICIIKLSKSARKWPASEAKISAEAYQQTPLGDCELLLLQQCCFS